MTMYSFCHTKVLNKIAIPISDDGAREDVAALPALMFVHDHQQY